MAGWLIHKSVHPLKGFTFRRGTAWYTVVDWYDRATDRTFMSQYGEDRVTKGYRNMVVLERQKGNVVPVNDEVVLAVSDSQGVRAFHHTQVVKEKGADKWLQQKTKTTR